jgi:hypothetical protein
VLQKEKMMARLRDDEVDDALDLVKSLTAELAQCRELSELRLQSEQKLRAERDALFEENGKLAAVYAERDRLRTALEEIASLDNSHGAMKFGQIARRALEEP